MLLELRARQLADTGEQAVLQRERRCLDDEVARDLVGLQAGRLRNIFQRVADERLERRDIAAAAGQCIRCGHDDRQQVGACAVAVDVDLPDQRAVAEHRLQLRDGDEFALRELQHVVAAVEVRELIGTDLGHDVAGAVVAVRVEHFGGDLRPLVVAGEQSLRFDQQLASGMWLVGAEVAQIGHVGQLVVDHRWASHLTVDEDGPGLGAAVTFHQVQVEEGLDECPRLGRDRRGARHRRDEPSAEQALPLLGHHRRFQCRAIDADERPPVQFALELAEQHVPDPRHEVQPGGPHQREVVQESREIALGCEIGRAAIAERPVQAAPRPSSGSSA